MTTKWRRLRKMEKLEYGHICVAAIADVKIGEKGSFTDEEIAMFEKAVAPTEDGSITFTAANNPVWVEYHKRWIDTLDRVRDEAFMAGMCKGKTYRGKTRTKTLRKKKTAKKKSK